MIKSPVTARDSAIPVSLRSDFSIVTAQTFFSGWGRFSLHARHCAGGGSGDGGDAFTHVISVSPYNITVMWIVLILLYQ